MDAIWIPIQLAWGVERNVLGPQVIRRQVLGRPENTTVALCQRVEALLAFPRTVLWGPHYDARCTYSAQAQNNSPAREGHFRPFFLKVYKGCHLDDWSGSYVHDRPLSVLAVHKVQASPRCHLFSFTSVSVAPLQPSWGASWSYLWAHLLHLYCHGTLGAENSGQGWTPMPLQAF